MQRYIETMMARARGRAVLQFNEVDFRLGWLRARFPTVPILHVYRHPRDQWCSTLLGAARSAAQCRLREFAPLDGFYLMSWARDLRHCSGSRIIPATDARGLCFPGDRASGYASVAE